MIKKLPNPVSKSPNWIIEAIRGLLEMAHKEEITEFQYSAIVGGEIRSFGYQAKQSEVMICLECDSEEFTLSNNGTYVEIDCSKCGTKAGAIDPK